MKISRSTSENSVFVVTPERLEEFCEEVSSFLPKIKITVDCADKLIRKFESFEEFAEFKNPKRSAIRELVVSARDEDFRSNFSLTLNSERGRNCRVWIDAEESTALKLNDSCVDFIDAMRPWYTWIVRADWYLVVFGGWLLLGVVGIAFLLINNGSQSIHSTSTALTAKVVVTGLGWGMLPMLVGTALNALRNRAFPSGTFAIGDGAKRHASSEVSRTVLIVSFAISIITGLAFSWF